MISLNYKGRIHRGKFTARSLRYIASDQAARFIPALQRRWLLPLEPMPIEAAATHALPLPSIVVETPLPECFRAVGISYPTPVQQTHTVYSLEDILMTGWAGAMMKNGLFLAVRPRPNWVSSIRARPHRLRSLSSARRYINLMTPIPARGHVFHWLFDYILPTIAYLESGQAPGDLGLIVNAARTGLQTRTLAFLQDNYGISVIEGLAEDEAIRVPRLQAIVAQHDRPRGLQFPPALQRVGDLAAYLERDAPQRVWPKRVYVSRNDARLRRVTNEDALRRTLQPRGFECVELSALPLSQQVALFRNAEAIIGPHGAAFGNAIWCRPGTSIIEFIPRPNPGRRTTRPLANSDFWFIALQQGLHYRCALAGMVQDSDAFEIPDQLLLQALDAAGLHPP